MKKTLLSAVICGLFITSIAHAEPTVSDSKYLPKKSNITTKSENSKKVGYSIGYMMGSGNKDTITDLDLDAYFQGFRDAYVKGEPALDKDDIKATLIDYQKAKEEAYAKEMQELGNKNLATGNAFLVQNAKKSSVKTTQSGLQYEVITEGKGKKPTAKDTVKVNYEGRLIDGTVFDSSFKRGEPSVFQLSQVIDGWTEGLQLMSVGSKYRLYLPAKLAYGETGNIDIEPNSTLIFDVELLDINPKPEVKK